MPTIPLTKRDGTIVAHAQVSQESWTEIDKYKWSPEKVKLKGGDRYYATTRLKTPKGTSSKRMHSLLMGPCPAGLVIDHMNGDRLDNRLENLRFATPGQNGQNRCKKPNASSCLFGVHKIGIKWVARCRGVSGPTQAVETQAGKDYDRLAIIFFGPNAKTNNLLSPTERTKALSESVENMPRGVYPKADGFYSLMAADSRNKGPFETVAMAAAEYKLALTGQLKKQEQAASGLAITRNAHGIACVMIGASSKKYECLVDDTDWHTVRAHAWQKKDAYAQAKIMGSLVMMHQYLTGALHMDHINHDGLDNRRANLRVNDRSGNSQNQKERIGTTSRFLGVVQKESGKFQAQIVKNGCQYHLGVFEDEEDAARAYNAAAPLYYDGPKLNDVPDLPEGVTLESRRVLRYPDRGQPDPVEDAAYFPKKYLGVTKRAGSYQVQMSLAGVVRHLGNYPRPSMAALAYNEAMLKVYDNPQLNQVEGSPGEEPCLDSEMAKFLDTYVKEELGGKRKKQRGPSSSYKGVTKTKGGKFQAYVCVNRVITNLGTFASEIEAAKAHNKRALEVFENPVLNDV